VIVALPKCLPVTFRVLVASRVLPAFKDFDFRAVRFFVAIGCTSVEIRPGSENITTCEQPSPDAGRNRACTGFARAVRARCVAGDHT
jgi:hypothetical protein